MTTENKTQKENNKGNLKHGIKSNKNIDIIKEEVETISTVIPVKVANRLRDMSREEDRTVSKIVRRLLVQAIEAIDSKKYTGRGMSQEELDKIVAVLEKDRKAFAKKHNLKI